MSKIIISERDLPFSSQQMLILGKEPSLWQRIRSGGNGTPAMVYLEGPEELQGWEKGEGDLCHAVFQRFENGILIRLNKTNWMKYVRVPDADVVGVQMKHLPRTSAQHIGAELTLVTTLGAFRFEVLYGQVEQLRKFIEGQCGWQLEEGKDLY